MSETQNNLVRVTVLVTEPGRPAPNQMFEFKLGVLPRVGEKLVIGFANGEHPNLMLKVQNIIHRLETVHSDKEAVGKSFDIVIDCLKE